MIANLRRAIQDRSAAGSLVPNAISGMWYRAAPPGTITTAIPYCVFDITETEDDTFTDDRMDVRVRFHLFATARDGGQINAADASRIMRGDSLGGSEPTFGYHRWTVGAVDRPLGDVWRGSTMFRVSGTDATEDPDDVIHLIEEYRLFLTRVS